MAKTKDAVYGTKVRIRAAAVRFITSDQIGMLVKLAEELDLDITIDLPGRG